MFKNLKLDNPEAFAGYHCPPPLGDFTRRFPPLSKTSWMFIILAILGIICVLTNVASAQWTPIPAPAGSRVLCISSTTGNDTSGTGSETAPFRSISKALSVYQQGDDLWLDGGFLAITNWSLSGTPTNPTVVRGWPGKPRPLLEAFSTRVGSQVNNLWLVDLIVAPAPTTGYALDFLGTGSNIRVEGCLIQGGSDSRFQAYPSGRYNNLVFNRTVIADATGNGVYFQGVDNLTLQDVSVVNIGTTGNKFKQGVYIHQSCGPAIVKGCQFIACKAGGLQQRTGGVLFDTFAYKTPVGLQMGHAETALVGDGNTAPYKANGTVTNCVVVDSANIGTMARGHGLWFDNATVNSSGNLVVNQVTGSDPVPITVVNGATASIADTIVYNWNKPGDPVVLVSGSTVTYGTNDFRFATKGLNPGTAYPAPTRGLPVSEAAYIAGVKANWRGNWNDQFTATETNKYVRAGFGIGAITVPPIEPPVVVPPTTSQPIYLGTVGGNFIVVQFKGQVTPELLAKVKAAVEAALK